jgi:hypothetical protein
MRASSVVNAAGVLIIVSVLCVINGVERAEAGPVPSAAAPRPMASLEHDAAIAALTKRCAPASGSGTTVETNAAHGEEHTCLERTLRSGLLDDGKPRARISLEETASCSALARAGDWLVLFGGRNQAGILGDTWTARVRDVEAAVETSTGSRSTWQRWHTSNGRESFVAIEPDADFGVIVASRVADCRVGHAFSQSLVLATASSDGDSYSASTLRTQASSQRGGTISAARVPRWAARTAGTD